MAKAPPTWETFRDRSYYDMWAVRMVGDRTFGQGIHVMTQAEAEMLRDLLNTTSQADALRGEIERLRGALATAKNDLLAVGNDYPGSSCQKWCTERAIVAWNVLEPWGHCPSTHCERSQECRAPNECAAARAALSEPMP